MASDAMPARLRLASSSRTCLTHWCIAAASGVLPWVAPGPARFAELVLVLGDLVGCDVVVRRRVGLVHVARDLSRTRTSTAALSLSTAGGRFVPQGLQGERCTLPLFVPRHLGATCVRRSSGLPRDGVERLARSRQRSRLGQLHHPKVAHTQRSDVAGETGRRISRRRMLGTCSGPTPFRPPSGSAGWTAHSPVLEHEPERLAFIAVPQGE